jgi:HK97 family phage portal protein
MSSYTTESGLVVTDRRHSRSMFDDPRAWPSNPNVNPPPPPRTVGPNASEGFGNMHVMWANQFQGQPVMPPPMMPWSGWPVSWATPNWEANQNGFDDLVSRTSIVFGCIDLNSSILSTMPPYRLQGGEVVDDLPWMRNPQPDVYHGWSEAMKQVFACFWTGEAFLWCTSRYSDGSVRSWVMLNPGWVDVEMEGHTRTIWLGEAGRGVDITDDTLHLRYTSWPGVPRGIGPLAALGAELFGVEIMESYQANLAARGGVPWGVLTAPGNLTQTQAEEMRERFVSARASALGAPAVLAGGMTLTPFTINPRDMALLELMQFSEARICVLLGVPPTLMGLPAGDTMTYRNANAIYDFHWRAYLRPKAQEVMEAISQWALPRGQQVELNRDEYTRPDFGERVAAYKVLFDIVDEEGERAITVDEIRAAERLEGRERDETALAPPGGPPQPEPEEEEPEP